MADQRDDTSLLLAAGRGDRQAFGALVELHHRTVVQFVHRFLGIADRATAEDVAQDVFLAAWTAARTFEPRASVRTWLLRITTNRCLNHARARRRRPTVPLAEDPEAADRRGSSDPGADIRRGQLSAQLRAAVAALAPRQRAVVVLRYGHGSSYAEIASVLQLSVPIVKSLLHRAHRRLGQLVDLDEEI